MNLVPLSRRASWAIVLLAGVFAACGGTSAGDSQQEIATTEAVALTTTLPPRAQVAPRTAPPPKVTTTVTTTTVLPKPAGFPDSLALPSGEVGYYTGSPALGFHLNISTEESYSELVRFFTAAVEEASAWNISVRDVGRGFLPGFENQWAIYTANDHVLTQLNGEYEGVIEIEGRHVNILLDPLEQPPEFEVPVVLPSREELPLPEGEILLVGYSAGLVRIDYVSSPSTFEAVLETYRDHGWAELGATESVAAGELAGWKIKVEQLADMLSLEFENLALSYP